LEWNNLDYIKVYDFDRNKIKEINNSKDAVYFIDSYYDNKLFKNYIITGNNGYVKSYDYDNNELYHKYGDDKKNIFHNSLVITINEKNINSIE